MKFKSPLDRIILLLIISQTQHFAVLENLNNANNLKILVTYFRKWKVLFKSNVLCICHSFELHKNPMNK